MCMGVCVQWYCVICQITFMNKGVSSVPFFINLKKKLARYKSELPQELNQILFSRCARYT